MLFTLYTDLPWPLTPPPHHGHDMDNVHVECLMPMQ